MFRVPDATPLMSGSYSPTLVALSFIAAMMASYIALDLAGRVTQSTGRAARLWLVGGAFAMGAGIWSMHFIGMLAFSLPVPMIYDFAITMLSMLFAIIISGLALSLVSGKTLSLKQLVVGGIFMGIGICAMHYTGMAAMQMTPPIQYDPWLFAASAAVAIGASMAALWLAFRLRRSDTARVLFGRVLAAIVMGVAIAGMHYTGMAGANFTSGAMCLASGPWALSGSTMAFTIGTAILCIFAATFTASLLDLRLARRTAGFVQSLERTNRELRLEIGMREEMQHELQQSEARFRSAFEHAPVGMSIADRDLNVIMVNAAVCRMLGYSETELMALDWATITHPDDIGVGVAELQKLKEGRIASCQYEKRLVHKNGRVVWANLSVSAVRHDGEAVHLLSQIQDITERKQLLETLHARSAELERSNRELEQFAYVASHDLQAPLRSVTSFVQLLQRRLEQHFDSASREYVQFIVDSTQQMQRLIHALLDLGRLGKGGVRRAAVAAKDAVSDAQHNLEGVIRERGAVVEVGLLPTVNADRVLLTQVLQNLIGNAIKFQPNATPWVGVTARRGQDEWIFAVADRGIGIEPKHFERLFKIFQRLHNTETYEGNGVGLAMCDKIVRLHGGQIWVESRPGAGSTFYFTIPDRPASVESDGESTKENPVLPPLGDNVRLN